jgi:hypothetical protein
MKRIVDNLLAFVFLGMGIVALVAGLILFSYLLLYGAIVGIILFVILWFKEKFFPNKKIQSKRPTQQGRIIDHDDSK